MKIGEKVIEQAVTHIREMFYENLHEIQEGFDNAIEISGDKATHNDSIERWGRDDVYKIPRGQKLYEF